MAGKRRPVNWRIALMIGPAMLVIAGLFGAGLLGGIVRSWGAWGDVLSSPRVWAGLGLSLWIGVLSTVVATLIAVPAALAFRAGFAGRRIALFLFQMNLTVPHLVGALGILYLFAQSGLFARLAYHGSVIAAPMDFPALVFDPASFGIILTYVWKEVPFLGLIALAALQGLDLDHESAARTLGATRLRALRHITLPLIWPALARGMIVVFAFTFGAYEVPALLGQTYPQALPVLAWKSYAAVDLAMRPQAMAMALLIAGFSFALIGLYMRLGRR
jgi:putative spermidine/putrescine transport system permease protein